MMLVTGLTASVCCAGVVERLIGSRLVSAFAARNQAPATVRPPVSVLKPLYGNEPMLEEALATLCRQDYPDWQIVFGVHDQADPAVGVVGTLRTRFPDRDIALVVDSTLHGSNRKVGNLINMLPVARHDILVIADSDVHARPDYLDRLVQSLTLPGVGLVTFLYAGVPAWSKWVSRLGAAQITYGFLPSALLGRGMGRRDCLGATMCLRRSDLARIGGLQALVNHLADDNVLGRRIRSLGLDVALASTIVLTTVPETRLGSLLRHELRWARTIRMLEPVGFGASILQYSLFWALLTILLSGGALWAVFLLLFVWILRAVAALGIDRALASGWRAGDRPDGEAVAAHDRPDIASLAFCCPLWLLPLRDVLSVAVMLASYAGRRVDWRGHGLHADAPPPSFPSPQARPTSIPIEGTDAS